MFEIVNQKNQAMRLLKKSR